MEMLDHDGDGSVSHIEFATRLYKMKTTEERAGICVIKHYVDDIRNQMTLLTQKVLEMDTKNLDHPDDPVPGCRGSASEGLSMIDPLASDGFSMIDPMASDRFSMIDRPSVESVDVDRPVLNVVVSHPSQQLSNSLRGIGKTRGVSPLPDVSECLGRPCMQSAGLSIDSDALRTDVPSYSNVNVADTAAVTNTSACEKLLKDVSQHAHGDIHACNKAAEAENGTQSGASPCTTEEKGDYSKKSIGKGSSRKASPHWTQGQEDAVPVSPTTDSTKEVASNAPQKASSQPAAVRTSEDTSRGAALARNASLGPSDEISSSHRDLLE